MEYLEDYDFDLQYHPGKANVVADALSRKSRGTLAYLLVQEWKMLRHLDEFEVCCSETPDRPTFFALNSQPALLTRILETQKSDDETVALTSRMLSGDCEKGWTFDDTRGLRFRDRVFIPIACREDVLKEFHHSRFAVHPGGTKMYHDLRR